MTYLNTIRGREWFVATTGSDSNSGLGSDVPLLTISEAIKRADGNDRILVWPGVYREQAPQLSGVSIRGNLSILNAFPSTGSITSMVGQVDVRGTNLVTGWSLHSAGTYKATFATTTYNLWLSDVLDGNGDWTNLTYKATVAEVESTASSWTQSAGEVYVHLSDGSDPSSASVEASVRTSGLNIGTECESLYVRGLTFSGGHTHGVRCYQESSTKDSALASVTFDLCTARYNGSGSQDLGNGFSFFGVFRADFNSCRAFKNKMDGFNFHYSGIYNLTDCEGLRNGDNGASPHESATMNVVGGRFADNGDQNLVAVVDSVMNLDGVISTGSGTEGIYYDDSRGRIVNTFSGGNVTGLKLVNSTVLTHNLTYGTGGDANTGADESIDGTSSKYVV